MTSSRNIPVWAIAYILVVLAIGAVLAYYAGTSFPSAKAEASLHSNAALTWFAGSDCIANLALGDFYPRGQNSSHCELGPSAPNQVFRYEPYLRVQVVSPVVIPTPATVVVTKEKEKIKKGKNHKKNTPAPVASSTNDGDTTPPPVVVTPPPADDDNSGGGCGGGGNWLRWWHRRNKRH